LVTGYSLTGLTAFSISTWYSFNSFGSDMGIFGDDNNLNYGIEFETGNTFDVLLGGTVDGTTAFRDVAYTVATNKLYHLVLTRSGTAVKVYIDGALVKSGTISSVDLSSWDSFTIGARRGSGISEPFNGIINETAIWNDDLSLSEVQELFNDGVALDATTHSKSGNLTGYWRNDGATTWLDRSISENLSLNGSSDYVSVANESNFDFDISDSFSFSIWVYNDDTSGNEHLFFKGVSTVDSSFYIRQNSANVRFNFANADNNQFTLQTSGTFSSSAWRHIVCTYDGTSNTSGMKIYVNGSLDATGSDSAITGSILSNNALRLGTSQSSSEWFDGIIDQVSVWDIALSSDNVSSIYNAGRSVADVRVVLSSLTSNLKLYYQFETENLLTATTITDLSGNGNTGTLTGTPPTVSGDNDGTPAGSPETILLPEGTTSGKDILGFPLTHTNNGWLNLDGQSITGHLDYKQYVDFTEIDLGELCTLSLWAKRDDTTNAEMAFGNDAHYVFYFNGVNSVIIRVDGTNVLTFDVADVQTALARTDWVYWTFVRDAPTTGKLYVDGVLEDSDTNGSIDGTTAISKIGSKNDSGQYCFAGSIDEARAYNRALSAPEITKNYNHGKGKHKN
jgi:hypothetical protein